MSAPHQDIQKILDDEDLLAQVSEKMFNAVDADHSGSIEKKELKTAMRTIARQVGIDLPTDEQVNEALIQLDIDGSGNIDLIEFKELIRQLLEALKS
ncbi:hypothetical protein SteCoe_14901 [Stentor coeruleus]|uniref:EF-hand domain-containing protein n=1 Tax=Stentor coeruleus TaxID=5963 RepID=A0A1R2C4T5_9CILI|nr:hypothetical protein SteCoe_14901 [Stentor coeruleus]